MSTAEVISEFKPNLEKLRKLQSQSEAIRIGGKGCPRRKKKIVHKTASTDDKKLQGVLKKLTVNAIQGIDEVNMFKDNGEILHFNNPKVQASLSSNIFAISGHSETKQLNEMLPTIMQQLGGDNMWNLKSLAKQLAASGAGELNGDDDDDDVPQLVENFDEASKDETTTKAESKADTQAEATTDKKSKK
jgi:nascent polypeptide-associated complex subunit beta